MTRIKNALLVLIGRYKTYNPKTHFISRLSGPRKKKALRAAGEAVNNIKPYDEGVQET
jgi:hypothetical protein